MNMNTNIKKENYLEHPFHMVGPSPWPFVAATGAFTTTTGGVMYMHNYQNGGFTLLLGVTLILFTMGTWWRDVVRESTYEGEHTTYVQNGLRMGMILFIVSEIMFFFAFFWAFFHSSIAPTVEIGSVWPPKGIETLDAWSIPLCGTLVLLYSGVSCTACHHAIVAGNRLESIIRLIHVVTMGLTFTFFQLFEYINAPFSISDGIYGSTFYMATGFHGFHVIIGTIFLMVCLYRLYKQHFTCTHHIGFESAAWYWHFVDVVWLFLFVTIYWWGGV